MGLPSDLSNLSSDSIPILLVALAAHGVCYIKSLPYCLLQRFRGGAAAGVDMVVEGSGTAGFNLVGEHANMSHVYEQQRGGGGSDFEEEEKNAYEVDRYVGKDVASGADCVVCLCGMRDGEQVRRLACSHVFHGACLEGWFDHQKKTSCPLCRAPLVSDQPLPLACSMTIPSSHMHDGME